MMINRGKYNRKSQEKQKKNDDVMMRRMEGGRIGGKIGGLRALYARFL